jgi:hypothetical protein
LVTQPANLVQFPEHEWALYQPLLRAALADGPRFAIGGGLAYSLYARRWRNTKDIDLFVLPKNRAAMIGVFTLAGFSDYYDQHPYDREWIYRGYRDGVIVDVIWQMANYRTPVGESWLTRGPEVEVHGLGVRLLPPEELLWTKLYVLQRERSDWPDLLNLLFTVGPELDWEHLLGELGEDAPVLGGLLNLFGWLCPGRARELPPWLWRRVNVLAPRPGPDCERDRRRVARLDRRDWFGPTADGGDHADRGHEPPAAGRPR